MCLLTHWLPMRSILFRIVRICSSLCKCKYLKNEKHFLRFLFRLWNLHQILIIFEKKMIVIANVFPKLQAVENLLKPLSWKRRVRASLNSQHVNWCQIIVKSTSGHLYHTFWSLWAEMICKISPLLKFEIFWVFVNTLTADDDSPLPDCESFKFPVQMQLS